MSRIFVTLFFLAVANAAILSSCHEQTVYRTASGLQFTLIPGNPPGPIVAGSGATVKAVYTVRYDDSIVGTTNGHMPLYQQMIPGLVFPYSLMEALGGTRAGDSLVVWQRIDSLRRKGLLPHLPAGWKSGDRLVITMKVLRVFPFNYHAGDSLVEADKEQEARRLLEVVRAEGEARMTRWLARHGITAKANREGCFLEVMVKGKGQVADSGSMIGLRYRCMTVGGKLLDANTDTGFHHPPVLSVRLGGTTLPPVIDATLRGLPAGTHARVYVPKGVGVSSALVARQGDIPGEDMVWEVWL